MVLTRVDLPRPVCPISKGKTGTSIQNPRASGGCIHTNTHNIELETTLQQLPLNLGGDTVETDVAVGEDGGLLSRSSAGSGGHFWRLRELKIDGREE